MDTPYSCLENDSKAITSHAKLCPKSYMSSAKLFALACFPRPEPANRKPRSVTWHRCALPFRMMRCRGPSCVLVAACGSRAQASCLGIRVEDSEIRICRCGERPRPRAVFCGQGRREQASALLQGLILAWQVRTRRNNHAGRLRKDTAKVLSCTLARVV